MRAILLGLVLTLAVGAAGAKPVARKHARRRPSAVARSARDETRMRAALREFGLQVLQYRRTQAEEDWDVLAYEGRRPGQIIVCFNSAGRRWSANTQRCTLRLWLTIWAGAWESAGGEMKRCYLIPCCDDGLPYPE